MPSKRFKKGDEVLGMWPGSRLYFKGTIVDVDEGTYDVKFEEGTTYTLIEKHVKSVSMLRQVESRSDKVERTRRTRSSSLSRSRSRSRSRTPSRATEKTPRRSRRLENSPKKSLKVEEELEDLKKDELKPVEQEDGPRRRSARLAARVTTASVVEETVDGKLDTIQKTEEESEKTSEADTKADQNTPTNDVDYPAGNFGAFFLLTVSPLLTFTLHALCIQHKGKLAELPHLNWAMATSLFDLKAAYVVFGFFSFVLISSLVPLGKQVELNGGTIRCNGIYVALVEVGILAALKYYFHFSASAIQALYSKFFYPALLIGFLIAIVASMKQKRKSGVGIVYDFVIGTDVNVFVAGINVKHLLMRSGLLACLAINLIFIEANFELTGKYSTTLLLACSLQISYFVLALSLENSLPFTFEYTHEKFGFMVSTAYALFPLLSTLSTYVIMLNQRELDVTYLTLIGMVFLIGIIMLHGSIVQKALFRSNPEHPYYADKETLSSPSGKKLLLFGWWGWLRHPNYLGDLLIHIAFALPCGLSLSVPYLIPLMAFMMMISRSKKVEKFCKVEHGPAWDRYCERVKYRMFPGIF